jgi:hypothetical protein
VNVMTRGDERVSIDLGDYIANDGKIRERLVSAPSVGLCERLARSLDYYRAPAEAYW